jgi:hypothetical protein
MLALDYFYFIVRYTRPVSFPKMLLTRGASALYSFFFFTSFLFNTTSGSVTHTTGATDYDTCYQY